MKYFFIILFILDLKYIFANEDDSTEVEVINLHESKSLDQMVLENLNQEEEIEEIIENTNKTDTTASNEDEVKQIEIIKKNFIHNSETKILMEYFENLEKINSKILQKQIIQVLENLQVNLETDKDKQTFFLIINYLQSIGQINKSYELIERYELSDDENFSFYTGVKLNYLLSTFQLNEACNFKDELNSKIKLDFFFLEKLDIFCLILNDNQSEANLLNSILIESEIKLDNYYQYLISLISTTSDQKCG